MSEFKIVDKKGQWVLNTTEFPLPDHQRQGENPGSELIQIAPGVPTKIELNDYLRGQPTLVLMTDDPVTGEPIKAPVAKAAAPAKDPA